MAAIVIPGPWSDRSETGREKPKVSSIEMYGAWADFFDAVGQGEHAFRRQDAWTMARFFRCREREEQDREAKREQHERVGA